MCEETSLKKKVNEMKKLLSIGLVCAFLIALFSMDADARRQRNHYWRPQAYYPNTYYWEASPVYSYGYHYRPYTRAYFGVPGVGFGIGYGGDCYHHHYRHYSPGTSLYFYSD